jgi:type IV pilus assembly protein PilV
MFMRVVSARHLDMLTWNGKATGLSLIEVLIALLVITVGLLGMAGLQAYSLKNNTSAYHRSQANTLGYDIIDSMRANRDVALGGGYNLAIDDSPSGSDLAGRDLLGWREKLAQLLPNGTGAVSCNNPVASVCLISVRWDDNRDATQPFSVQLSTRL